jgi:hypothetical protein
VTVQITATERKERVEVEDEQPEPKEQLSGVKATVRKPEEPTTFRVESNAGASEDIEWSVPFTFAQNGLLHLSSEVCSRRSSEAK